MKVEKHVTINLGNYQTLRIGVMDVDSYEDADKILLSELQRLNLRLSDRIRQALFYQKQLDK